MELCIGWVADVSLLLTRRLSRSEENEMGVGSSELHMKPSPTCRVANVDWDRNLQR